MQNKLSNSKVSVLLLFISVLLSYYISPFFKSPQTDRQVFIYGSMTILKGGVPYKDFFDHKPPLIYLILALGWPFKWWGVWLVGVVAKWIAAIFLYRAAAAHNTPLKLLVPVTFLVTILNPFIIELGSFTREYSAVFIAIATSIILMYPGKKYVLTGFMLGLIFFTQQEVIYIIPFIIWHLFVSSDNAFQFSLKLVLIRILKMLTGFLFVLLPLIVWLYSKGALYNFWEHAFLYNFTLYQPGNTAQIRLENSLALFYHSRVGFFILGFIVLHTFFIIRKKNENFHKVLLTTLVGVAVLKTFFSRLGEEYDTQHYFLAYSVLFAISVLFVLKEFKLLLKDYKWKLAFSIIFVLSSWFLWENALTSRFTQKEDIFYKRMQEILPTLQEVRNKDGQLFVFRTTSYIYLYNELNCLSPSKWIYTTTYNAKLKFETTEYVVRDIIKSLELNQTLYIVDLSIDWPLQSPIMRNEWNKYLYSNYTLIKSTDGYALLKRTSSLKN